MWALHVKMANQNLLKMLMMRNCLLGNICCWEIVKSLSRLESNSLTFLQLVKAVKTSAGGATGSMFYFDFSCTMNFPFPFLMEPLDPKPPEEALYLRV